MTHVLTQTSRAAIVAAALALPALALALPAMAQTATDTAPQEGAAGTTMPADGATMDDATTGGDMTDPADTTTDMDTTATEGQTPAVDTPMGTGENTGSAMDSGGSADMDQLTYERVVGDLQSGRDFTDQLDGIDDTTTITVTPLSELEQMGGGALSTADQGTPPMTGGQTTNQLAGDGAAQTDNSGASAGAVPDAPAGMADGLSTGGGTDTMGVSMGTPGDIDMALEQAGDSLIPMQTALMDHEAVTEALEADGYDTSDVIALHRDGDELTVVVDDRDS